MFSLLWQLVLTALGEPSMATLRPRVRFEWGCIRVLQFLGSVTRSLAGTTWCLTGRRATGLATPVCRLTFVSRGAVHVGSRRALWPITPTPITTRPHPSPRCNALNRKSIQPQ